MKKNLKSKLKKFFAGILSTAMVISTMAFTGFAADETIDEERDVTLTIYSYLWNLDDTTKYTGTGSANDKVPADRGNIENAEFSVWKIADITQTTADNVTGIQYNNILGDEIAEILGTITDGNSVDAAQSIYELIGDTEATATGKTNDKSICKFTGLSQGLYLVAETDAPAKITRKAAPFLVSLPTTYTVTKNGTTTSQWLYDVYAYPKSSSSPTITIHKKGKIAGTDDATAVPLAGAEFYLQWTSDYDNGTNKEWKMAINRDGTPVIYTTDENGDVTLDNLPYPWGTFRLIEKSAPEGYIVKSNEVYVFYVMPEGQIYTQDDRVTKKNDLSDQAGGEGITVINEMPTIEKSVLVKEGSSTNDDDWQDIADYSVGDNVTFKINVTVPENIEDLTTYTVTDTFTASQFEVDDESFKYAYYDKDGNTITSTSGINLSATVDNTNGEWTLNLANTETATTATALADAGVSKIEITYTAKLLSGAVTAGSGNANEVSLEFTSQIYDLTDSVNPTTPEEDNPEIPSETITDSALVLTFGIQLDKLFDSKAVTDGSKTATFNLYRVATAGETGATTIDGVDGSVVLVGTYTTDTKGQIILNTSQTGDNKKGFSNGKYYFVETVTEKGYNLLKEPVEVDVQVYYTVTTDADGNTTITYYSDENKEAETKIEDTTTYATVNNKSGFTFPITGGRGTILFTVVGILIMLAAVSVFFVSRKRKTN